MNIKIFALFLFIGSPVMLAAQTIEANPGSKRQEIRLSPDLLNLLRLEMIEIANGVQRIAISLVTADWESVQETSKKMRDSYIMNKKLSPKQAQELEQALPERFKELDAEFHQRADKLGKAAESADAEAVVFQYSRLIENCTLCHASYAGTRFPGFTSPSQQGH